MNIAIYQKIIPFCPLFSIFCPPLGTSTAQLPLLTPIHCFHRFHNSSLSKWSSLSIIILGNYLLFSSSFVLKWMLGQPSLNLSRKEQNKKNLKSYLILIAIFWSYDRPRLKVSASLQNIFNKGYQCGVGEWNRRLWQRWIEQVYKLWKHS